MAESEASLQTHFGSSVPSGVAPTCRTSTAVLTLGTQFESHKQHLAMYDQQCMYWCGLKPWHLLLTWKCSSGRESCSLLAVLCSKYRSIMSKKAVLSSVLTLGSFIIRHPVSFRHFAIA